MSTEIVNSTIKFLHDACSSVGFEKIVICFHGGEPLMAGKKFVDQACTMFRNELNVPDLMLGIQTNGVLLDEEWARLFEKHDVKVGVSIDGPRDYHDEYRVDANGHGTYDRIVTGLKTLQNYNLEIGTLSVINPNRDPIRIYQHFVNDLMINTMDFLLPDLTYDQREKINQEKCSEFLIKMFDEWINSNDEKITIRCFNSIISLLTGGEALLKEIGPDKKDWYSCITVFTNGDIAPADDYCSIGTEFMHTGLNVLNTSFKEVFKSKSFVEIQKTCTTISSKCLCCPWKNVCFGGARVNRYSYINGFDNPSAYCEVLSNLFEHIAKHLLKLGYSLDKIMHVIEGE
jgi:uncharacterized protein